MDSILVRITTRMKTSKRPLVTMSNSHARNGSYENNRVMKPKLTKGWTWNKLENIPFECSPHPTPHGGGLYYPIFWVRVCRPCLKTVFPFQTQKSNFLHPCLDQTWEIDALFQTRRVNLVFHSWFSAKPHPFLDKSIKIHTPFQTSSAWKSYPKGRHIPA